MPTAYASRVVSTPSLGAVITSVSLAVGSSASGSPPWAMISAQGGDPDAPLPVARETHVVNAPSSGVLTRLDALAVGVAAWRLGAGRARKEDPVQAAAGVQLHAKPGDRVTSGQPLITLHTDTPERFGRAKEALDGSFAIGPDAPERSVIMDRID